MVRALNLGEYGTRSHSAGYGQATPASWRPFRFSSDESDTELEGVYQYTRTRTGVIAPVDYSALARGIELSESHFAIIESHASNTSVEKKAFVYMANTPEEMTRHLEQQAQV